MIFSKIYHQQISDAIGKNKSYIYHPKCDEICPESCPYGYNSPWKIVIKQRPWDIDPKMKLTCGTGMYLMTNYISLWRNSKYRNIYFQI